MADQASDRLNMPVVTVPPGSASAPDSVIRFLVEELVRRGMISADQADRAVCHVIKRESLGSTALAGGVAVPHSKTDVPRPTGIIGYSATPIPWDSASGVPVVKICLLLMPADDPQAHFRALEEAARALSDKKQDWA